MKDEYIKTARLPLCCNEILVHPRNLLDIEADSVNESTNGHSLPDERRNKRK